MLHSFTLRQQLQTARQELSHALYQHDAACRVIARLTKEVTAAREALATLKPQAGVPTAAAAAAAQTPQPPAVAETGAKPELPQQEAGMTPEVIKQLQDKATVLTQERKKRGKTVPEELVTPETLRGYRTVSSNPVSGDGGGRGRNRGRLYWEVNSQLWAVLRCVAIFRVVGSFKQPSTVHKIIIQCFSSAVTRYTTKLVVLL